MYSIPVDESISDLSLQVSSSSNVENVSISDSTGKEMSPKLGDYILTLYDNNHNYDLILQRFNLGG